MLFGTYPSVLNIEVSSFQGSTVHMHLGHLSTVEIEWVVSQKLIVCLI